MDVMKNRELIPEKEEVTFFMVDEGKKLQKTPYSFDGQWGIYLTDNFLPCERFDPFCSYIDDKGSIIGHKTIFSPVRLQRPLEWESKQRTQLENRSFANEDTFCHLISGNTPAIIISKDLSVNQDPFSTKARYENLLSNTAFSTINLYPPVARIVQKQSNACETYVTPPMGLSLVHLFTNHYILPEEVPIDEWEMFLLNYRLTINACINHPKISSKEGVVIHTFFNIGERAGASIPHLHGQTVLFWNQPGSGSKSDNYWKSSKNYQDGCIKCQLWLNEGKDQLSQSLLVNKRLIFQNAHWKAFLAYAPEKDAQIRLLPKRHVSALWNLNDSELTDLAPALIESNQMLTDFIKQGNQYQLVEDRNIIIRQFPLDKENHFHMFIDILPVQQLGGAEAIDNQKFSFIFPETIASKMRRTEIQEPYS